ncbi:Ger(x)C family spore germination protein [Shimazuella sp. AN120528]|uniref:Ger(x)C family spore germination protein n=1 Tax=Shimazuella soli TaxID=1892854 RepID=UPI001F0FC479|nr:Ger(x)C family spore germination protein [Shimazuella soli]MCH5584646.1 Ger(x)C family spore germination protein [Shimazuella soli]
MFQLLKIFLVCCSLFIISGCWDSKDIEELAMEVGAALDKTNAPISSLDQGYRKKNIIKMTLQNISPKSSPQSDKGGQQQKYENVTGSGDSILEIFREISLKKDVPPYGAHLKILVIGEKLVKEKNLQILLALFDRTFEVRDSCIILIAKGSAAQTLKLATDVPAFTLVGIEKNRYRSVKMLPAIRLGKVMSNMADHANFIIQSTSTKKRKVKFNGGAIIKGNTNRLIGFLNEDEVAGLNFITGEIKGGIITGRDPKTHGLISYEISSVKSKIIPHLDGEHISFDVNIESEGRLNEEHVHAGNAFANKFLKRAEMAIKKEVEHLVHQSLNKLQKKYQIDVAGFNEQMRIQFPKEWLQLEKDWDKRFSQAPIKSHVSITIRDYMIKGKKEISD